MAAASTKSIAPITIHPGASAFQLSYALLTLAAGAYSDVELADAGKKSGMSG